MKTLFTPLKTLSCAAAVSLLAACASSNPSGTPDGYYRVQSGDTLNRIAMRFNQTPAVLAKWNNLSDPSKISVGQLLRVRQNAGGKGSAGTSNEQTVPHKRLQFNLPSDNAVLTRYDGSNKGIDFDGKAGDPVKAAADGKIMYAGNGVRGYGNLILISHTPGTLTAYAHNDKLLVKKGQTVRAGDTIATMGSSDAERVKLHFEVRINGKAVNPEPLLPALSPAAPSVSTAPAPAIPTLVTPAPAIPAVETAPAAAETVSD